MLYRLASMLMSWPWCLPDPRLPFWSEERVRESCPTCLPSSGTGANSGLALSSKKKCKARRNTGGEGLRFHPIS